MGGSSNVIEKTKRVTKKPSTEVEIDFGEVNNIVSEGTKLIVSEIFGPTYQGEGPNIGKPTAFLRLGGCNLHCGWCDTPYTWRFSEKLPHDREAVYDPRVELRAIPTAEVANRIFAMQVSRLVVTGGEPLLQSAKLTELLMSMRDRRILVEFETNGTIVPQFPAWLAHFNVSPKLSNSGNKHIDRFKPDVLKWFVEESSAIFKFVVAGPGDLEEIDTIVNTVGIPGYRVYLMPLGIDPDQIQSHLQDVADAALGRRWNLTTRLHIQLWGNRRGV
jgi:7-carboxy-7-deazaguanine synthase